MDNKIIHINFHSKRDGIIIIQTRWFVSNNLQVLARVERQVTTSKKKPLTPYFLYTMNDKCVFESKSFPKIIEFFMLHIMKVEKWSTDYIDDDLILTIKGNYLDANLSQNIPKSESSNDSRGKIIINVEKADDFLFSIYEIISRYPMIEWIPFHEFKTHTWPLGELDNNPPGTKMILLNRKQEPLVSLIESVRFSRRIPEEQHTHQIIKDHFRSIDDEPFNERSLISQANQVRREIELKLQSGNDLFKSIKNFLLGKFTDYSKQLDKIFSK